MDRHEYVFGERRINEKVICAYSGFSGYFADPDGYLWEIACDLESYSKEMAVILEFDRGEFLKVYWDAGEAILTPVTSCSISSPKPTIRLLPLVR